MTYISRAYGITIGGTWVPAVVPVADFGNTAPRAALNARWFWDEPSATFRIATTRAVRAPRRAGCRLLRAVAETLCLRRVRFVQGEGRGVSD